MNRLLSAVVSLAYSIELWLPRPYCK